MHVKYNPTLANSKLADFYIADGTLESLKWLALVAMTSDHINQALFHGTMPLMSDFGRIAMPLFGFVLAYNLARHVTEKKSLYNAMKRMAFFGLAATPFYVSAFEKTSFHPLNIMFTLLLASCVVYLIEQHGFYQDLLAMTCFIIGGIFVEYHWFALGYCLSAWYFLKTRQLLWLGTWLMATGSFYFVNDNFWGLAALPIVLLASTYEIKIPRLRLVFYCYYPLHLFVLWLIKAI